MSKREKYENRLMQTVILLLGLTLISLWMLSNMYAKYTQTATGEDRARVAGFVFDLSDTDNSHMIDLQQITKPGDSKNYDFTVTNEKSGKINETKTTYTIQLEITGNMPLKAVVTNEGNKICEIDASNPDNNPQNNTSKEITFSAGTAEKQENQLTVEWPKDQADSKYANGAAGHLKLIVKAQQAD